MSQCRLATVLIMTLAGHLGVVLIAPATAQTDAVRVQLLDSPAEATTAAADPEKSFKSDEPTADAVDRFLALGTLTEVRTAAFQDLTPGVSTEAAVREKLGEPKSEQFKGTMKILSFAVGPFPKVEVELANDVVQVIAIELAVPTSIQSIESDLQLARFEAAPLFSARGDQVGQVYPERGMVVLLQPRDAAQKSDDKLLAERVVLRTVRAADFLDRIRYDQSLNYRERLEDAQQALQLEPGNEEALWFRARLLGDAGFTDYAYEQLDSALAAGADTPRLRLEVARLEAHRGRYDVARQATEKVLARTGLSPLVRARAQVQLGHLLAHASAAEYKPAVQQFMASIETASLVTRDNLFAVRREARELILEAHLGVADAIARGGFRKKVATVNKWLANADAIARRMRETDHASPAASVLVWTAQLRTYAVLEDAMDPQVAVTPLMLEADKLLARTPDELFQRYLRTLYGEALLDAAAVFQRRGAIDQAQAAARRAAEVLSEVAQQQPPHAGSELLLGQAYFVQGSLLAVAQHDHAAAVPWYDRAWPLLSRDYPASVAADTVLQGEKLVSMGISYWQADDRQRGTEVTLRGVELIRGGSDAQRVDAALLTAYHNLSVMHESLGDGERAANFAELARQLEGSTRQR